MSTRRAIDELNNDYVILGNARAHVTTVLCLSDSFAVALVSYSARQGLQLDLPVVLLLDTWSSTALIL